MMGLVLGFAPKRITAFGSVQSHCPSPKHSIFFGHVQIAGISSEQNPSSVVSRNKGRLSLHEL